MFLNIVLWIFKVYKLRRFPYLSVQMNHKNRIVAHEIKIKFHIYLLNTFNNLYNRSRVSNII